MKLYATTTSERATKGQGGNKYLDITILWDKDKKQKLLDMRIEIKDGKPEATIYTTHDSITDKFKDIIEAKPLFQTKGEKQKGEINNREDLPWNYK